MRQNVVVVWLQCLLVDVHVVGHTGTFSQVHVDLCTPKSHLKLTRSHVNFFAANVLFDVFTEHASK